MDLLDEIERTALDANAAYAEGRTPHPVIAPNDVLFLVQVARAACEVVRYGGGAAQLSDLESLLRGLGVLAPPH